MARLRGGESALARPHGKRRRGNRPWGFFLFSVVVGLLLVGGIVVRLTFALVAPHVLAGPPAAVLSTEKRAQLDQELDFSRPFDRDQAIDFALGYTADSLTLSLPSDRPPSFEFGVGKRKGGAAEHASLFVAVFEAAAKRVGSTAQAWRVKSQVQVFGRTIPGRSFSDHEWVLVHDPADGARIYLDPTLSDAWLGASLTRNVKGGAAIPISASK